MMTRSLVNDDDVSMMTSWTGRAAHADTLGLGRLALNPTPLERNPSPLAVTLAPTLAPLRPTMT